jgi:DNA processing protein
MKNEDLLYYLALCRVEGIGPIRFRKILEQQESVATLFTLSGRQLKQQFGLPENLVKNIKQFSGFKDIEKEILQCHDKQIRILTLKDKDYPYRLLQCADAPPVLYVQGTIDLNMPRMLSVVGTRQYTAYGKAITEKWIEELAAYEVGIISGLAFGIDAIAHQSALQNKLPTAGVLAHGLHTLYPMQHSLLAKKMIEHGGLLTEYPWGAKIDIGNFPTRNRIVAGLSDATLVIETDSKGGSMITAEMAWSYHRDVFCVPGRIGDEKSRGCNLLIEQLKAQIVTSAGSLAIAMGWKAANVKPNKQLPLFVELSETEHKIISIMQQGGEWHIDTLKELSHCSNPALASALLNLEMQQLITQNPGKTFTLSC